MQLAQLRRPAQAAALSTTGYRPVVLTSFALPIRPAIQPSLLTPGSSSRLAENGVAGRRYASVKSQGAYKIPNKKTIAKKLGAKRTGDQFVIPGNIIYKQRGTIWHAGENAIRGRDHTIHAAVEGYVKYYRDPERHPDKQYIGVAFNKEDTLPYPRNEPRRRKLNMVPTERKVGPRPADINASGLPRKVVIPGGVFNIPELEKNLWRRDKKQELSQARKTAAQKTAGELTSTDDAVKNAPKIAKKDWNSTAKPDYDPSVRALLNRPREKDWTRAVKPVGNPTARALVSARPNTKKANKKGKKDWTGAATPDGDSATGTLVPVGSTTVDELPTESQGKKTRTQQRRFVHPLEFIQKRWLERRRTRTLHFNATNYSYTETNTAIGRLASRTMYIPPWKLGGRRSRFRSRRQRREKALLQQREREAEKTIRKKERRLEAERKRAARLAKQLAAGAGKKNKGGAKGGAKGPLLLEGPAGEAKPVEGKAGGKPAEGKKPE